MSRVGMGRSFLNSLKGIIIRRNAKEFLVGTDEFGNKYYERPASEDPAKGLKQIRRVEPITANDPTTVPEVPAEWMTWLQERRQNPPSPEEVHRNRQTLAKTLQRAQELEQTRAEEDGKSGNSGPTAPTGINFPVYDDYKPVVDSDTTLQRKNKGK